MFASGRDTLVDEQRAALIGRVADALADKRFAAASFTVTGYTDNVPVSNRISFQDNRALSRARAQTVEKLLAQKQPALRLGVSGKGESNPIADNNTPEGRARNRRVEIVMD